MPQACYDYVFACSRAKGGGWLGQFPANLDLEPASAWGRFSALRCWSNPELAAAANIRVEPRWDATAGQPFVDGLRVSARARGMPTVTADIPSSYFRPAAAKIGNALVAQKQLEPRERFDYKVLAFLALTHQGRAVPDPFGIVDVPIPMSLSPGNLNDQLARSVACGETKPGVMPVFVPQRVIDEVLALTEAAGAVEVGSILIGHLRQDGSTKDLFLEITAQIPARHAVSESARLSLTAATWSAVQAALELRGSSEQQVGFYHCHPARYWCDKECPPEARQQCPLNTPFFSATDCHLHRVAFSQPYCVALLVTNAYTGMKVTMYGWNHGVITQRPFQILKPDATRPLPAVGTASLIGTDIDENSCHT